ncbi:hypothetical protein [Tenacibaculum sp. M341]|uniref:hypothetical protein n=1 Tax=Tenacibaculum sp. M341 TaxID=2530339 RepID=UPI00104DD916|nr:hypothetical protein [Tenacibaculum sp. M341]TCI95051.1 hypothetical protein EYW44_01630 [Tenacibaculum sp. M341]
MISPGFIKIIESTDFIQSQILVKIAHIENGIPPETKLYDTFTNEYWIVKKRVHTSLLIQNNAEKFFDCETQSIHIDNHFVSLKEKEVNLKKDVERSQKGIYFYILQYSNKKLQKKQIKGNFLRIETPL